MSEASAVETTQVSEMLKKRGLAMLTWTPGGKTGLSQSDLMNEIRVTKMRTILCILYLDYIKALNRLKTIIFTKSSNLNKNNMFSKI
jgi:hypothetical protein